MKTTKSYIPKKITRVWHEIDVSAKPMGRIATEIANLLRGKNKRDFTPHMDLGDFVVAINVEKMKFTGRKLEQVMYHHYTGYPGGLRSKSLKELMEKNPEMVLRRAVTNMIDDMKIRKQIMRRLKMVRGTKHEFNIDKKA
jgi:large subunit ribosomal protein L13